MNADGRMASEMALCSVERKCSSTGVTCSIDDRVCQSEAVAHGLEVTCERPDPRAFIYCPPGGQQRDSGAVWILLAFAMAVAVVGSIVSWMLIRRRVKN